MSDAIPLGRREVIDGQLRVHYYGYWIKVYDVPADTLLGKKQLIEALTRRLFNHVEHGINVPGKCLDSARAAFENEDDPARRRVKGAMLAGALFNRATDIFTKLVEIQALGVAIEPDNALMRQCGEHLQEALTLGKMVLHRSGEEGLDELWGEPFKAFAFPIEAFYNSRYIKIAQSMQAIDMLRDALTETLDAVPMFAGVGRLLEDFARAAKVKCEILRTDGEIFDVWASFVVAAERLVQFRPHTMDDASTAEQQRATQGLELIVHCKNLMAHIARARVPMPKSADEFFDRCTQYRRLYLGVLTLSVA